MNETKKITIIGGGISGLYAALLLSKNPQNEIKLFEKNNYFGGRIYTYNEKYLNEDVRFEAGAGRISVQHKLFQKLIKKLDLYRKTRNITFEKDKKIINLIKILHNDPSSMDMESLRINFGYDAEFKILSKEILENYLKKNFEGPFYTIENGLSKVIESICIFLFKCSNVKLYLQKRVTEISKTYSRLANGKIVKHDLILCTIQPDLYKYIKFPLTIRYHIKNNILSNITSVSLCRIYVFVQNIDVSNVPKLTSNGPIRMLIPLRNYKNFSTLMIYTDSKWADWWNINVKNDVIMYYLKKFFPTIKVLDYRKFYWKHGVYLRKKNNNICNTYGFIENYISFVGEFDSCNSQGWIEGSLESIKSLIDNNSARFS